MKRSATPVILITGILSGCLATVDLKTDQSLSSEDRRVATRMAELTQQRCTHYTYDPVSDQKFSGDVKITQLPAVKRLYRSESGWVKAEMQAHGVWDSVYYRESGGDFICGEKVWQKFSNSNSVGFSEVGKQSAIQQPQ